MAKRIPIQTRSKATVDRIIRAATQIIEKDGSRAISTNSVAARAKVGVASVYEYFDNKDEILVAVLEREMAELWLALETRVPKLLKMNAEPAMRSLFTFAVNEIVRRSHLVRAAAGYVHGATDLPAGVRFLGHVEMLFRMLLRHFGRRSDADTPLDAHLITHAIVGIGIGVATGLPPGKTPDDVVEWLLRISKGLLEPPA